MADIRIDRYEFDVSGTSGTLAIFDVGDIKSAFINHGGNSTRSSGGQVGSTGSLGPDDCGVGLEITGATEITYAKNNGNTQKVMFEVWVYTGSPGGAYEFITRQRGSLPLTNGNNNVSTPVLGLTDRNQAIPTYTGFSSAETSNSDWEANTLAVHINVSGEIVFSRNNNGAGSTITPYYEVVEFTGSAWNVYTGVSSSHDTGNDVDGSGGETVPLNTDSTGMGGTIITAIDWTTAMIIQGTMEGDTSETGLSDCQLVVRPDGNDVRFTLDNSNSRNDGTAYCYVLQCNDLVVSRRFQYNFTEGNNSYGTTLAVPAGVNSSTPLSELGLEKFFSTSGEGTAWARGCLVAQITANTGNGLQHWVHRQGNNVSISYAFIDVSALVDSVSGTIENLSSDFNSNSTVNAIVSFVSIAKPSLTSMLASSTIVGIIGPVSKIKNVSTSIQGSPSVNSDIRLATNIKNLVSTFTGAVTLSSSVDYIQKTKNIQANISGISLQGSDIGYTRETRNITTDLLGGSKVVGTIQYLNQNVQLETTISGWSLISTHLTMPSVTKQSVFVTSGQSTVTVGLSYIPKTIQTSVDILGGGNAIPLISYGEIIKSIQSSISGSCEAVGNVGFKNVLKKTSLDILGISELHSQVELYRYMQSTIMGSSQLEGLLQEKVFGPEWREVLTFVCELERVFNGTSVIQRSLETESRIHRNIDASSEVKRVVERTSQIELSVIKKSQML